MLPAYLMPQHPQGFPEPHGGQNHWLMKPTDQALQTLQTQLPLCSSYAGEVTCGLPSLQNDFYQQKINKKNQKNTIISWGGGASKWKGGVFFAYKGILRPQNALQTRPEQFQSHLEGSGWAW